MQRYNDFTIDDLFEKIKTKSLNYKAGDLKDRFDDEYNLPALTAGVHNQGLAYFVPREGATVISGVISVSANGANSGVMFYQPNDFTVLQDSYAIKFKSYNPNDKQYLYLVAALQKTIRGNYNWTNKAGWERIKTQKIILPVTDDGRIDFAYMENYISKIKATCIGKLEEYINKFGFEDYALTAEEMKILAEYSKGKVKYKYFNLGDVFEISTPKKKFNANAVTFGGKYRYVARGESNNGIRGYIDEDQCYLNPANTISFGQDTATMFFQNEPYFTGDKIKIFSLTELEMTREMAIYLIVAMKKAFVNFSWGTSSFNVNILKTVQLLLPVTANGNIDYDYMTRFIRIQQKLKIGDLVKRKL